MEGVCDEQKGLLEYVRKSSPPPFLLKTYMLVEDPATDDVISWNDDGSAFVVWQTAEFARDLLPTLFKHSNFSSFVRQLNTYGPVKIRKRNLPMFNDKQSMQFELFFKGFRKVATNRWEFCNDKFRKGEKDQLCDIRRRKAWATKPQPINNAVTQKAGAAALLPNEFDEDQRSSSTSSSSEFCSLVDENKRLKQENGVLSSELTSMKQKCKELLHLVARYGDSAEKEEEDNERVPKLFGVRLEVAGERERKRKRAEISKNASVLLSQACK